MKWDGQLLILGDSITLGVAEISGDEVLARVNISYVEHLSRTLEGMGIEIDAALHRTTSQVLQAIECILRNRQPDIVLLMVGGNDADLDWRRFILSGGRIVRNRVSVERYTENLTALIDRIQAAGACPLLTDFPRQDLTLRGAAISRIAGRDLTPLLEQGGGQEESDRQLEHYRQALRALARESGARLVAYGARLQTYLSSDVLSRDGAHPNDLGHQLIARELAPAVARAMIQQKGDLVRNLEP